MLRNVQRVIRKRDYRLGETTGADVNAWAAGIKADGLGHRLPAHQGRWLSAETDKQHQTKTLYVMNVEGKRTTGPLLIGLLDYIQRWLPNVGYFEVRSCCFLIPDADTRQPATDALFFTAFQGGCVTHLHAQYGKCS